MVYRLFEEIRTNDSTRSVVAGDRPVASLVAGTATKSRIGCSSVAALHAAFTHDIKAGRGVESAPFVLAIISALLSTAKHTSGCKPVGALQRRPTFCHHESDCNVHCG